MWDEKFYWKVEGMLYEVNRNMSLSVMMLKCQKKQFKTDRHFLSKERVNPFYWSPPPFSVLNPYIHSTDA